jgi:hypothetical protein
MKATYFWQSYLKDFHYCKDVVKNFEAIQKEVSDFAADPDSLQDYPRYKVFDKWLYDFGWKAIPFSRYEGEFISTEDDSEQSRQLMEIINKSKSKCPAIASITSPIEDAGYLRNAFISKLEPGTVIRPHNGWTSDFLRIHLPIIDDPECRITVGTETQTWKEGEILSFMDGDQHSVKHKGTRDRVVISVDIKISYVKQFVPELKDYGNETWVNFLKT